MPMPAGSNDLTLGAVLADLRALTDEDCSPAMRAIWERLVEWWIGAGCPGGKKPTQEKMYSVYYRTSDGAFVGGNPQDPVNPHVLLASAGGTIIVEEEGTPLVPRGIINFIGASVTAADDGVDTTNVTITGGSSDSFKTISCSGSSSLVADSATDTLNLVAGALTAITLSEPGSVETATFASTLTIFRALVNDATHVVSTDATFLFDSGTSVLGTAPSSGTATNFLSQAYIDNEVIWVIGDGTTYYAFKALPSIATANINEASGVAHDDTNFDLDSFTGIIGVVPSTGVAVNLHGLQLADNQELLVLLRDDGKWVPLKHYDTALVKVTTGITARAGTYTWGAGAGTILRKTGTATHSATNGITGAVIYNSTLHTAAVDDVIQVKRIDGEWFWDVADCEAP
jgi:hypothetical protein